MTQNEVKQQRPEKWDEVKGLYLSRQITSDEASKMLGVSRAWFFRLLHRDNPGRKTFQTDHAKAMGQANRKFETHLEQNFSDYTLCKAFRSADYCDRCPLGCGGKQKNRGLLKKLLEKTPLKADRKLLEKE